MEFVQSKRGGCQLKPGLLRQLQALNNSLQRVTKAQLGDAVGHERRFGQWDASVIPKQLAAVEQNDDEGLIAHTFLNSRRGVREAATVADTHAARRQTRRLRWADEAVFGAARETSVCPQALSDRGPGYLRPASATPANQSSAAARSPAQRAALERSRPVSAPQITRLPSSVLTGGEVWSSQRGRGASEPDADAVPLHSPTFSKLQTSLTPAAARETSNSKDVRKAAPGPSSRTGTQPHNVQRAEARAHSEGTLQVHSERRRPGTPATFKGGAMPGALNGHALGADGIEARPQGSVVTFPVLAPATSSALPPGHTQSPISPFLTPVTTPQGDDFGNTVTFNSAAQGQAPKRSSAVRTGVGGRGGGPGRAGAYHSGSSTAAPAKDLAVNIPPLSRFPRASRGHVIATSQGLQKGSIQGTPATFTLVAAPVQPDSSQEVSTRQKQKVAKRHGGWARRSPVLGHHRHRSQSGSRRQAKRQAAVESAYASRLQNKSVLSLTQRPRRSTPQAALSQTQPQRDARPFALKSTPSARTLVGTERSSALSKSRRKKPEAGLRSTQNPWAT